MDWGCFFRCFGGVSRDRLIFDAEKVWHQSLYLRTATHPRNRAGLVQPCLVYKHEDRSLRDRVHFTVDKKDSELLS